MVISLIGIAKAFVDGNLSASEFSDAFIELTFFHKQYDRKEASHRLKACIDSIFLSADAYAPREIRESYEIGETQLRYEVKTWLLLHGLVDIDGCLSDGYISNAPIKTKRTEPVSLYLVHLTKLYIQDAVEEDSFVSMFTQLFEFETKNRLLTCDEPFSSFITEVYTLVNHERSSSLKAVVMKKYEEMNISQHLTDFFELSN